MKMEKIRQMQDILWKTNKQQEDFQTDSIWKQGKVKEYILLAGW